MGGQDIITGAGKKTKTRKETPVVLADIILPVLEDLCQHTKGEKIISINRDNFYTKYHETMARVGCRDLPPYSCRRSTALAALPYYDGRSVGVSMNMTF